MKTHEHALISLGYGACLSLLLGGDLLFHPIIYLTSLAGGEIIDFIDHPLYHLVYHKSEKHVAKSKEVFRERGLSAYIRYLNQVEDGRLFTGLILHNIYGFLFFILLGFSVIIVAPRDILLIAFFSAIILHMITDIVGDLQNLGHLENWLWVIPPKIRAHNLGKLVHFYIHYLLHAIGSLVMKSKRSGNLSHSY